MTFRNPISTALAGAAVSLSLALPTSAEPGPLTCADGGPEETGVSRALAAEIWDWVAGRTEILDAGPPDVCVVPAAELEQLQDGAALSGPLALEAAYLDAEARVLVRAPWNATSVVDRSTLVHEFVHHAQALLGTRHACPAEAEREAYAAQAEWLGAYGNDLEAAFGIDRLTLFLLTTCGI